MTLYEYCSLALRLLTIVSMWGIGYCGKMVWVATKDFESGRQGRKLFIANMKKRLAHPGNFQYNHIHKKFGEGLKTTGLSYYNEPADQEGRPGTIVFVDEYGEVDRIKLKQ